MTTDTTLDPYPTTASKMLRRARDLPWKLAELRDALISSEFSRLYRVVRSYTMLSNARLRGLYLALRHVERQAIPGDVVECGTARGGSAGLMGLALRRWGAARRLWVMDTFEGLPPPSADDPDYDIAKQFVGECLGTLEEVLGLFQRLGIADRTTCIKGLFQDTVPNAPMERIAVLHLDGDWYESVKVCLDHLYDRVAPGGVIQIDDYGHWAGGRKATDEFLRDRDIRVGLRYVDYTGRQFVKPAAD